MFIDIADLFQHRVSLLLPSISQFAFMFASILLRKNIKALCYVCWMSTNSIEFRIRDGFLGERWPSFYVYRKFSGGCINGNGFPLAECGWVEFENGISSFRPNKIYRIEISPQLRQTETVKTPPVCRSRMPFTERQLINAFRIGYLIQRHNAIVVVVIFVIVVIVSTIVPIQNDNTFRGDYFKNSFKILISLRT